MTTEAKPIEVDDESFQTEIESADGLAMVDFWAEWCGPCRMVSPIVEELAEEYEGQVKVAKVDVDESQRTAQKFNVRSIPSILFFKDGEHVDTVVGAVPKGQLEEKIEEHL
ncbi:MAG: thioredoxin [Candidatus Palauibacterales bacterium]|nr:thioredoxin [Candidatus Palauibacterales bacterium]